MPVPTEVEKWNEQQARVADERHMPIIQAYRDGVPQHEIAKRTGYTRGWISRVISRARERGLLEHQSRDVI